MDTFSTVSLYRRIPLEITGVWANIRKLFRFFKNSFLIIFGHEPCSNPLEAKYFFRLFPLHGGEMIKGLEKEIGDLTEELAEVQKDQALLRLQPCRGDSDIREKDAKFDELDRRGTIIR
jgi:hypothetical protein